MNTGVAGARGPILFADRGAWHGYTWGARSLVDAVALDSGEMASVFVEEPIATRHVFDDRMEARLESGGRVSIYYLDARTSAIRIDGEATLTSQGGPFQLHRVDRGYYHHTYTHGPELPGEDLTGLPRTLRWNWRAPHRDMRHGGIVPSPHAYPGIWAWDS